jgi:hypothetical protein
VLKAFVRRRRKKIARAFKEERKIIILNNCLRQAREPVPKTNF